MRKSAISQYGLDTARAMGMPCLWALLGYDTGTGRYKIHLILKQKELLQDCFAIVYLT
jgi:hypothetical protein